MGRSLFPLLFEDEDLSLDFSSHSGLSVSEDDKHVFVEASVPGLDPSDIEISFDKDLLTIEGEKKEETKNEKRKFHRKSQRSFCYKVTVPGNIDHSHEPEATCDKGVLKVTFNKVEGSKAKKIPIK